MLIGSVDPMHIVVHVATPLGGWLMWRVEWLVWLHCIVRADWRQLGSFRGCDPRSK